MQNRSSLINLATLALATLTVSAITACGSSDSADSGVHPDAAPDAGTAPDAEPADGGEHPDALVFDVGPRDGGHYCNSGGNQSVHGTEVPITAPAAAPTSSGNPSQLACIDSNRPPALFGRIRLIACMEFVGATPSQTELGQLDVSVFNATQVHAGTATAATDPTWDRTSGRDKMPGERLNIGAVISTTVAAASCPSRVQVQIGLSSSQDAITTDATFMIRIRNSTTAANPVWSTSYFTNVIYYPPQLGVSDVGNCTPQTCYARLRLLALRETELMALATSAGAHPAGIDNLHDGVGDGYAMVESLDCQNEPMAHATAGFAPAPGAKGYLDTNFAYSAAATETELHGLAYGLGFTAPGSVTTAIAVNRDGTCGESFGGGSIPVFPDSISVFRSGRSTTLHP